jgi:DNA invertase Pin-like site-specific DNA recombinase
MEEMTRPEQRQRRMPPQRVKRIGCGPFAETVKIGLEGSFMERERLKIAIYARVSTKNGQDPEMQLAELREYVRSRKWKITGEYVDKGISGASDSRPELNRLMADANRRRFDVVVVWKFDRFARSVSHLLRALETFRALGIEFVSLSENIDTSTPTGKMVFTVLASVSELERSLIGERVRAGLRNAKARGKRLGRPPLKDLTVLEMQRLRSERRRLRSSFKELAEKYGVSVWTAFQLCKRARA